MHKTKFTIPTPLFCFLVFSLALPFRACPVSGSTPAPLSFLSILTTLFITPHSTQLLIKFVPESWSEGSL